MTQTRSQTMSIAALKEMFDLMATKNAAPQYARTPEEEIARAKRLREAKNPNTKDRRFAQQPE